MPLILISTERFVDHQTPPGHPESPGRAEVMDVVASEWRKRGGEVVAPRAASQAQLARVHDEGYVRRVMATSGQSVALDPDTYTCPDSIEVACLAAGAAIDAVERVVATPHERALALVRPPGHHAERNRAMGFCLFNNVAVAAAHARTLGVSRIAIVDFDVHHGNATQHMFEDDPHVLYVSLHQSPYYPGTGDVQEVGQGRGAGFTVNVPLEVGAVDQDYQAVFSSVVSPIVSQFGPGLVLVSAGFDAHHRDPLAGMRVTAAGFAAMTMELRKLAQECCEGRIALVTEGGYDLHALAESLLAVVEVLAPERADTSRWPGPGSVAPTRGQALLAAVKAALGHYWKL